jgi:hypothetical protein
VTVRRRLCRALECPRHVDDGVLFCNVHWNQLGPRYQAPIVSNQDVPPRGTPADAQAVASGTAAAVSYIARKEGRARSLKQAQSGQRSAPAPATDSTVDSGALDPTERLTRRKGY